jgi:hypothetical protein
MGRQAGGTHVHHHSPGGHGGGPADRGLSDFFRWLDRAAIACIAVGAVIAWLSRVL